MWTNEQLSYLAGIIDGEGSISVDLQRANGKSRKHDYYSLRLIISNTSKELMEWLKNTFGGSYYARHKENGCKLCYSWRLFGVKILDLMIACHPYLIIKKPHAELVIEFRKTVLGKTCWNIPQEILKQRYELYMKFKQLNKQGDHN